GGGGGSEAVAGGWGGGDVGGGREGGIRGNHIEGAGRQRAPGAVGIEGSPRRANSQHTIASASTDLVEEVAQFRGDAVEKQEPGPAARPLLRRRDQPGARKRLLDGIPRQRVAAGSKPCPNLHDIPPAISDRAGR